MDSRIYHTIVPRGDAPTMCDALQCLSGLSKTKIKRAMIKGAAWHLRSPGKKHRIRRATFKLRSGDQIWLCYDERILERNPPQAHCHMDHGDYSVWFKPAGLMSQGSRFGDHCALTRQVEAGFSPARPVYLIHRLDREVSGLLLLAHNREAAARLSSLLRTNRVEKRYQACLKGAFRNRPLEGGIDLPLDGRPAITRYKVVAADEVRDLTTVQVKIHTGRRHQIRRHFDMIGHPVMGDPIYGIGNSCSQGLQLVAYAIGFECPFGRGRIDLQIPIPISANCTSTMPDHP